jgi:sigma-B regulation protein RsbU (phosphoserine phosphatase)
VDSKVFERIRGGLLEKRQHLTDWLSTTPAPKKQVGLGPANERAVQAHLDVIDTALEEAASKTLGVCSVCHDYVDTDLLVMDYTACVCIDHLSEDEIRRLEYELELSQTVQQALLPQQVPDIPGVDLAAFSRPAEIVGGDYFDFFRFPDGAYGLTIADVAGKGVSASLIMASLQTALRALVPASESPTDVLRQLNRLFCHNIQFTTFVTLFLGSFDPASRALTYGNAGHNPPLLYRRQRSVRDPISWLRPTGAAIGLVEGFQFTTGVVTLAPGDVLLLYTDGVTEAINLHEEEFGPARLEALIQEESDSSAKGLVRALRRELRKFTDGQPLADDTTIVACKITG